jgi:hypothetical protein
MFTRRKQFTKTEYLSVGLVLLLLLVAVPVGAQTVDVGDVSYSGDDPYDPAAGGLPAISLNPVSQPDFPSGAATLSGDDSYDPAAGGLDPLSDPWVSEWAARRHFTTLSGDDAYDPAAGGTPQLYVAAPVSSSGSEIACAPSDSELKARSTRSVDGGLSGDDAYDPAAGGTPEQSLLDIGVDLVDCLPTVGGK